MIESSVARAWCGPFLQALPTNATPCPETEELAPVLLDVVTQLAKEQPNLPLEPEALLVFLSERWPAEKEPATIEAGLNSLHLQDLHLAWSCLQRNDQAMEHFEKLCLGSLRDLIGRFQLHEEQFHDLQQQLREELLFGKDQKPPKLLQYKGQGQLKRWVRVAATHKLMRLRKLQQREVPIEQSLLPYAAEVTSDAELEYMKRHYRKEFKQAFAQAMKSMDSRDRNILRYHYLKRMNIDQIGQLYDVHRATAARWLKKIRETLSKQTQKAMMQSLQIEREELDSIIHMIQSQLDISMIRYFQPASPEDNALKPPDPEE